MLKVCKTHGLTEHTKNGKKCRKCNVEWTVTYHKMLKTKSIEYKGGKCVVCGYDKCHDSLDFHHTIPKDKKSEIATLIRHSSWETIKEELDKCILVCRNCHGEIHNQQILSNFVTNEHIQRT